MRMRCSPTFSHGFPFSPQLFFSAAAVAPLTYMIRYHCEPFVPLARNTLSLNTHMPNRCVAAKKEGEVCSFVDLQYNQKKGMIWRGVGCTALSLSAQVAYLSYTRYSRRFDGRGGIFSATGERLSPGSGVRKHIPRRIWSTRPMIRYTLHAKLVAGRQ
ncbi:hypothetical protein B0T17DRAFT_375883 [Bombardia bombarda]|uniref:Uncharacterized protein n=1 Tax=Bombardia bombarda TaxID=252184 RepID=A0AA39WGP4_9PEZI|nr:hypothetical protein B0T17DRAFT_375883 [Bombardia bombarda]